MQLLALLTLHANKALSNEWVAAQLWPDTGSLDSLGHTVPVLRKALGDNGRQLIARSGSLQLDAEDADIDCLRFQQAWENRLEDDAGLRPAVDLYNGALLQDWFEPWVGAHRSAYRDKYLEILQLLVRSACRQADVTGARRFLRRMVAEGEPANELHVRLMELLMQAENYLQASRLYEEYRDSLRADQMVRPPARMTELYGRIPRTSPAFLPEIPEDSRRIEPVGGAMPIDSKYYVRRDEDTLFHAAISRYDGIICLKGPRQAGKSSLLARGLEQARQAGARVVFTDFQTIEPSSKKTIGDFYLTLANAISEQLEIERSPSEGWSDRLAPGANFERFLRREALADPATPVVWAIDEADAIFDCDFRSSVFGLFRSWYNARALNSQSPWSRFTLVLTYSTEAHLFITNLGQSPFNVGTRLVLRDFTLAQVSELNGYYDSPLLSEADLFDFYGWIGGHPFLTRLCLYEMTTTGRPLADIRKDTEKDDGIFGEHLDRLRVGITADPVLLSSVRQVLRGDLPITPESHSRLRSGGILAGASHRDTQFRCTLYQEYLSRVLQ